MIKNFTFLTDINLTREIKLRLTALTPLSMSTDVVGNIWHSTTQPSNNKIYGLLENILGYHIPHEIRKEILKKLKVKEKVIQSFSYTKAYIPIIFKCVEIKSIEPKIGKLNKFYDATNQHWKATDARHINGSKNIDYRRAYSHVDEVNDIKYTPFHYTTLKKREYIVGDISYDITLSCNETIYQELLESNSRYSAYLGTSDSLINIEIL